MISIKDYAKNNNVSYEAVRKQVKRYEEELEGHIYKQNRMQLLDDEAVKILDKHRQENPIVILNQDTNDRIKQLEEENKNLLIKIATQADKIAELSEWKSDNALLIAESKANTLLLEDKTKQIDELKAEINRLKATNDELSIQLVNQSKSKNPIASLFSKLYKK